MILRTYRQSPNPISQFSKRAKHDPNVSQTAFTPQTQSRPPHATQRSTACHAGMTLTRAFIEHDDQHIYGRFEIPCEAFCSFFHISYFSISRKATNQQARTESTHFQHGLHQGTKITPCSQPQRTAFPSSPTCKPNPATKPSRSRLPTPINPNAPGPPPHPQKCASTSSHSSTSPLILPHHPPSPHPLSPPQTLSPQILFPPQTLSPQTLFPQQALRNTPQTPPSPPHHPSQSHTSTPHPSTARLSTALWKLTTRSRCSRRWCIRCRCQSRARGFGGGMFGLWGWGCGLETGVKGKGGGERPGEGKGGGER